MVNMITLRTRALTAVVLASMVVGQANDSWIVRKNSVGPVRFGISLAQLNTTIHEKFVLPEDKDERECFYVEPKGHKQVGFMIEHGRVARVDVTGPGVETAEGIQVGDTEKRALQVYGGKLKVEPHAYTGPEGHYLTAYSDDGKYGIRFETDGKRIDGFYAGLAGAISYIEGCS